MADQVEVEVVLRYVIDADLPPEEPISKWIAAPDADSLKLRASDHALLINGCEYLVDWQTGCVEVRDMRDPRSLRYQKYDPARKGQPFLERDTDLQGW